MAQAGPIEPRAGESKHIHRQIKAKPALNVRTQKLEHASGPGAEIEQAFDRRIH